MRTAQLPQCFDSIEDAAHLMTEVLLHEAREAFAEPITTPPVQPYLHPVDVDTDDPGIVDDKETGHVLRCAPSVPRVVYARATRNADPLPPESSIPPLVARITKEQASSQLARELRSEERKAATVERNLVKRAQAKREREEETPEERQERLEAMRDKRRQRKEEKTAKEERQCEEDLVDHPAQTKPSRKRSVVSEDALLVPEAAAPPPPPRRRGGKCKFFEHPIPHHRHLFGLQVCGVHPALENTLLRGEPGPLEILSGPPGTGKTRALVARVRPDERCFLCAPTNVGAINLYLRCCAAGLESECALIVPQERVPAGTVVASTDVSRRILCSTLSARGGGMLVGEDFDSVFVDEAGQCMEAWLWTVLRPSVRRLVLAGDVRQLSAQVSRSGEELRHGRSTMERLLSLGYPCDNLLVQNRMSPAIFSVVNRFFYDDALASGPHAPPEGELCWVDVPDGHEVARGTSYVNEREAELAVARCNEKRSDGAVVVLLTAYAAQRTLLLSKGTGCEVHTVDSFQGREADVVILSLVRDGTSGLGFWDDERRAVVAFSRARTSLHVLASSAAWGKSGVLPRVRAALTVDRADA